MPKKKLTKMQVKKKMALISRSMYDLLTDKLGHADSLVPMSQPKLLELNRTLQVASRKLVK